MENSLWTTNAMTIRSTCTTNILSLKTHGVENIRAKIVTLHKSTVSPTAWSRPRTPVGFKLATLSQVNSYSGFLKRLFLYQTDIPNWHKAFDGLL